MRRAMAEREQILADFQACTGNDHIEECIAILEQYNWNLIEAVQNAMAGEDAPGQVSVAFQETEPHQPPVNLPGFSASTTSSDAGQGDFSRLYRDFGNRDDDSPPPAYAPPLIQTNQHTPGTSASAATPGTSNSRATSRMLNFTVEYRDRNVELVLSDTETVGRIKELLEAQLCVPVDKQELRGWVNKNDRNLSNDDSLRDLKLPKENLLFLLTPDFKPSQSDGANGEEKNLMERLSQTFTLIIKFKDKDRTYQLNFPGSKTIQEVKRDVFSLIDIPVRHQQWSGWPGGASDETLTLAGSGVTFPCHMLEVSGRGEPSNHTRPSTSRASSATSRRTDQMEVSDDEEDYYADAPETINIDDEDVMFGTEVAGRRQAPLMPSNASNQTEALECFSTEFANRYGDCHPVFYIGSLEDAIKDALHVKAKERRLLAIYLHHDGSILSNVFCSQILCSETIVSYLSSNFLTWAWDLTSEANKARLLTMCTQHFGSVAANTVRNFKPDQLPLLLLISRTRSVNEVVNVIHANVTLDELMSQLLHAIEVFQGQQGSEVAEEAEREAREQMKQEQDMAYEESLMVDRAKAEAKRAEEEEKRQKEIEEQVRRQEEDDAKRQEEQEKEAIRLSVADQLPEEPSSDCSEPITMIRIRGPGGTVLTRRFLAQNPLQVLLNYIVSKGFHLEDYKVLTTFPRRDLTSLDGTKTLEEMKMCPQETVILEERHEGQDSD